MHSLSFIYQTNETCFDPCFSNTFGIFLSYIDYFTSPCLAQIPSILQFTLKPYDFWLTYCKNIDCFKEKWACTRPVHNGQTSRHICVASVLLFSLWGGQTESTLKEHNASLLVSFQFWQKRLRKLVKQKVQTGSGLCFFMEPNNSLYFHKSYNDI